jgi:tetratricopeptide (TPR) repeat protein
MLWDSKGYIQSCVPGGDVPRLAVSSTPEEWEKAGHTLLDNQRYLQAMHAFERAGLALEVKISKTHYLREVAQSIQAFNKETRSAKRDAFCSVANSFLECAHDTKGNERRIFFHNAAACFEKAGSYNDNTEDYGKAARAYEDAQEYPSAVGLYRKTEMFDEAVNVVQNYRQQVGEELANNVQEVARLFYFKNKEFRWVQLSLRCVS